MAYNILRYEVLSSTNSHSELLDLSKVEEFTTIWALSQEEGVGQRGNRWHSQAGRNITASVILHPTFIAASRQFLLTQALSLAVADTIRPLLPTGCPIAIKWPNDIYVADKKICGILTTAHLSHGTIRDAICGIGLNVNETTFPPDLPQATSLALHSHESHDLQEVLIALLDNIRQRYGTLRDALATTTSHRTAALTDLVGEYHTLLYRRGIPAHYLLMGDKITATITGTDERGRLTLSDTDGRRYVVNMKEIVFL